MSRRFPLLALVVLSLASPARAGSLDLGVDEVGISLGNSPRWTGLRINAVDRDLEYVRGVNLTLWKPHDPVDGSVDGVGLGLWGPAADELNGVHVGLVQVDAYRSLTGVGLGLGVTAGRTSDWDEDETGPGSLRGLMVGVVGIGAGQDIEGVAIGGIGAGAGGDLTGIVIGGIGMGAGGSAKGLLVGGLGAGVGEDLSGIAAGGLGFGVGGDARGLVAAGLGAGIGGGFTGISLSGVGTGVSHDVLGFMISGLGHGVGGDFRGISLAGAGAGVGSDFTGISASLGGLGVGDVLKGFHVAGLGIAAAETRAITVALATTRGGVMQGLTIGAYNHWETSMTGLSIGLVNVTDELHGVQLGLINVVREREGWNRVLPILNVGR